VPAWRTDLPNLFDIFLSPMPSPVDTDADGLPDDFELEFGLDPETSDDPMDDDDGDRHGILMEYVLGLNPIVPDGENAVESDVVRHLGEDHLALKYRRKIGLSPSMTPRVEVSANLVDWERDDGDGTVVVPVAAIDNGDGTETVTVRMVNPLFGSGRHYYRIVVGG